MPRAHVERKANAPPNTEKCVLCSRKVETDFLSRAKHLYEHHPQVAAKNMIQSAPQLQRIGQTFGEILRKAFNHDR